MIPREERPRGHADQGRRMRRARGGGGRPAYTQDPHPRQDDRRTGQGRPMEKILRQ